MNTQKALDKYAKSIYVLGIKGGENVTGERTDKTSDTAGRLSVAVDVALLSVREGHLYTLVLRREQAPFQGVWALPGAFVSHEESLEDAADRVLRDKIGLGDVFLEQLYTFGQPGRDPRARVVAVAYYALVDRSRFCDLHTNASGATRVARIAVPWEGETGGPVELSDEEGGALELAFDHPDILGMAVKRIRGKLNYTPIGFQLLPARFTLRQLQQVHETVLGRPLNKDSFRRRMLASDLLEATGDRQQDVDHRPAELYRFGKRSAV
ncbi:MAG: NUDIX domain-containing protein [Deltaproteobacteria bacterium]|nr:NUDIX domain-containing protein [Deltaproteobacteria bacterium]